MNEEEKTDNQHSNLSEEILQYECEQAFLRKCFKKPSTEEEWKNFRHRIQVTETQRSTQKWKLHLRDKLYVAASIAAVLMGILWLSHSMNEERDTQMLFTATETELPVIVEEHSKDIGLENKTVIARKETKVVRRGTVFSAKEADYTGQTTDKVRTNIVSIPCGQVYKIILNDGTEVWLRADSRLIFPTRFVGSKRLVKLEGEAYFKVARNEKMPFIIKTEKVTTQVLGTEFNVKTYKNSEAHITLVNGSVKVQMPSIGKEVMLVPGEDITYAKDEFLVKKVDTSYYTQWREGYFYFDDMYLSDILRDLGRWYNITIEMEKDSMLMNQKLHFVIDRSEKINQIIENLNNFEYLSVAKKENKLTVRRKK